MHDTAGSGRQCFRLATLFANGRLSSPFREIKSTVQHRSYRLSSVQGWEGGGKEIHRSVIEELSEIFQRPNEKEVTACLQSCNVRICRLQLPLLLLFRDIRKPYLFKSKSSP